MHHSEPAGDPSGTRKMAHPAIFTRRGSGTGGVSALTTVGSTSISNNLVPTDDYQSPVVMQPPPPAGSSSPGPQHPPHSLNLLAQSQMQPQAIPSTGAQIKKKSGFQITSVTPAQISVSTNNSIAEDTESYDDLDESHTEDLSSSEILDVSLSRATDMGGPERSSSEETLSNLHDAETPGAVSPNQPPHPLGQPQPQPPPPQGAMVNGTVHHHHHHHRLHHYHGHHQVPPPPSGAGPPPPVPSPGGPVGGTSVPASVPCPSGALPSVAQTLPVSVGAIFENACGAVPVTQTPVAVGSLSTAAAAQIGVVGLGAGNTSMLSPCPGSSSSGGGGVSPGPVNPTGASMPGIGGQTAALIPQQPSGNTSVGIAMTTAMTGATLGGQAGAMGAAHHPSSMAPVTATPGPPGPTQTQAQAPTAASSRFRVVKLDSSSEPFRKGRWTCTEYYDKESTPPPVPLAVPPVVPAAVHPAENPRQAVPETVACTEVESTSGSSVSTLSHYSESVGSGEMGGPSAALDYAQAPPQDVMTPLPKTTVAPQQMSYPPPGVQPTAPVPVGYPPPQQPPLTNPAHVMPVTQGAGLPPEYAHHQPVIQTAGKGQLPPAAQPLPQGHLQAQGPSPQIAPPSQGVALPQMLPGNVSEVAQPQHLPEQQPPAGTQPPSAPVVPSQVASNVLPRFPANPLTRAGLGQGAPLPPASALYASLPSFTATQLEDATQRLLFQHPSLFSLPKLAAAERGLEPGASLGPQDGNATNALPVSAGLFPLKSLPVDGEEDSSSGASVVAIDNKIEQAMDLVKSHLMYAVREEVEVLKEQIKELIDRNSQLEQENNLLKNLASPEQLAQFQAQVQSGSPPPSAAVPTGGQPPLPPAPQTSGPSA